MSRLLHIVGAVAAVVGVALIFFGAPDKEFSFGNTLIMSGVTAIVGGLIVIALGVVASQLQQLNEALTNRAPPRPRPVDLFEGAAARGGLAAPARVPFPPKPKAEPEPAEPPIAEPHIEAPAPADFTAEEPLPLPPPPPFAPMLRNPEEPPLSVEEGEVPLAPPPRAPVAPPEPAKSEEPERYEPKLDAPWRPAPPPGRQPPPMRFDTMWPEPKPAPSAPPAGEMQPAAEAKPTLSPRIPEPAVSAESPASEPHNVAILKSGVVDGMGYTLYVDGSIEAELPQGTLRFGSINELRAHLEKNT